MPEFIHSIHAKRAPVGGVNVDITIPMPILPLSHILITLDATVAVANTLDNWINLLSAFKSIQFRWRGTQIWALNGLDLYRVTRCMGLWQNRIESSGFGAAARRIITLCIPFGRPLYDPVELFPQVNKGETELFLSWTALPTGYTTLLYTVESIQIPDVVPKAFMRGTTISSTPAATGDVDYDLPRSAPLLYLGVSQTASEPASALATIEQIKILANNQDQHYSMISGFAGRANQALAEPIGMEMDAYVHGENTAVGYTQNASTINQVVANSSVSEFMWLPFDALHDGTFALQAQNYQDLKARITFNTAAAIRLLPIEFWGTQMVQRTPTQVATRSNISR